MEIHQFTVGPFAENTYLLSKEGSALLIDPGFANEEEFSKMTALLDNNDLELHSVILTHAHVDHVLGLERVLKTFDIPVYLCNKDYYLWENFPSQATMFGFQANGFDFAPSILPIKEDWQIGPFQFDVRYTPGHAPDHVSLYSKNDEVLIVGDALFREGIGRTDLYKGDMNTLKASIQNKLYVLPEDTAVYPGHGPQTTIGHEKQANPFVKG